VIISTWNVISLICSAQKLYLDASAKQVACTSAFMRDSGELITIGKKIKIVKYIQQAFKILKKH